MFERAFGTSFQRAMLCVFLLYWAITAPDCAVHRYSFFPHADAKAQSQPSDRVTLPRTLWSSTMKELIARRGEIKILRAKVEEKDTILNAERNACASRLASERLRHAEQIKLMRSCPQPIACYVGLGICGAAVVGAGVGGYFIGKAK